MGLRRRQTAQGRGLRTSLTILLGSGIGFAFSLALKNDKGGFLSAALVLFGIMTIWLPPVRAALFQAPIATVLVLILLALIFKFAQAGGTVGLMTGGVLALYVIFSILDNAGQSSHGVTLQPTPSPQPSNQPPIIGPQPTSPASVPSPPVPSPPVALIPPEQRTLLAADGAILKFVAGISYRLKIRTGRSTTLRSTHGAVRYESGNNDPKECFKSLSLTADSGSGPWREFDHILRACRDDAVVIVEVRQ